MKLSAPLALVFAAIGPPAFGQAPKWATYAASADGFSIQMPGPTRSQNQSTQGVQTHIYLSMAQPFICAVTKTSVPPGTKQASIDQMVAGMKGGLLRSSGATATGSRKAAYGGRPGEQTDFKMARGGSGSVWITRTPNAVYSLTIAKPTGTSPAEAKRFFGSFKTK